MDGDDHRGGADEDGAQHWPLHGLPVGVAATATSGALHNHGAECCSAPHLAVSGVTPCVRAATTPGFALSGRDRSSLRIGGTQSATCSCHGRDRPDPEMAPVLIMQRL